MEQGYAAAETFAVTNLRFTQRWNKKKYSIDEWKSGRGTLRQAIK